MRLVILTGLLIAGFTAAAAAQDVYVSRNAEISFFSSAPIEDIQAETNQGVSAINTGTGSLFFKVPVKSFQFEKALMQKHFNSDYLESDKYPYAEFRGKISAPLAMEKDTTYPVTVTGQLTVHGVTRDYTVPGTIGVANGGLTADAAFKVRLADHKISIPRLLLRNIAEVVEVKVNAVYSTGKSGDDPAQLTATHE